MKIATQRMTSGEMLALFDALLSTAEEAFEGQCDTCGHLYDSKRMARLHEGDHPGHKVLPDAEEDGGLRALLERWLAKRKDDKSGVYAVCASELGNALALTDKQTAEPTPGGEWLEGTQCPDCGGDWDRGHYRGCRRFLPAPPAEGKRRWRYVSNPARSKEHLSQCPTCGGPVLPVEGVPDGE